MHLSGAAPFLLCGGRHGVLLIHGFTGLPAELRLLGEHLHAHGFTVLAIRLAGHGTTVEDLSRMGHEDWMDSVRDGYAVLSGLCDRISVVGHSMGAVFAMLLSTEAEIAHVVSLCAPIMIAPEQGLIHLPRREACIGRSVPKARRKLHDVPQGANNTYRRMPLVSVHELVDMIEKARETIHAVHAPILIVHGARDHTADPAGAEYIYTHVASVRREKFIIEDAGHLLPLDSSVRMRVFERTTAFLLDDTEYQGDAYCFACSKSNPIGLRLGFREDAAGQFRADKVLPREYQSYDGVAHGGIVATMLDEAMGGLLHARGMHAVTARLAVRFHAPTPVETALYITGRVDRRRGKLVDMSAEVCLADGTRTAEGSAVMMIVRE